MDSVAMGLLILLTFLILSSEGLDLSGQGLRNLDLSALENPDTIVSLNLSRNKLQDLPEELFSITRKLEVLDLQDNLFEDIPRGSLQKLKTLNLSRNSIKKINAEVLKILTSLENLDLSFNQLRELPENFLHILVASGKKKRNLHVYLQNNRLTSLPEEFIPESDQLKTVRLSGNLIRSLPNKLFKTKKKGLLQVNMNPPQTDIDLSFNLIREIFNGTLNDASIQLLNLSSNKISFVHYEAFTKMKFLTRLDLSHNSITDSLKTISMKVSNLVVLRRLNLEHNNISSKEEDDTRLFDLPHLFYLNLRHNQIKNFCPLCFSLSLGQMFLDHNAIEDMHITTLQLRTLSQKRNSFLNFTLQGNPVVNLVKQNVFDDFTAVHSLNATYPINILTDNVNCDCRNMKTIEVLSKFNINWKFGVACEFLSAHGEYHAALEDKYRCEMRQDCGISNCYCDYFYNCPTPLTRDKQKKKTHVFCDVFPTNVVTDMAKLDVFPTDGESNENSDVLVKVKNVKSNDEQIDLTSLSTPGIKVSLDLSFTKMTELPKMIFPKTASAIYLDNNLLTTVSAENVDILDQFLGNNSKSKATISNNSWVCNCEKIRNFCFLLEKYHLQIIDVHGTTCSSIDTNTTSKSNENQKILMFCSNCKLAEQERKTKITTIVAVVLVGLAFILVMSLAYWKCIKKKKVFKYDAFVSFSHTESDFVYNNLIPALEMTTENVKVCVHSRDWIAGVSIMDNLLDSLAQSKCFLAVISRDYLASSWCCKEFKTMYRMDRKNIILIIVNIPDDREIAEILPELKYHIREFTYVFAYEENLQSKLMKRVRET